MSFLSTLLQFSVFLLSSSSTLSVSFFSLPYPPLQCLSSLFLVHPFSVFLFSTPSTPSVSFFSLPRPPFQCFSFLFLLQCLSSLSLVHPFSVFLMPIHECVGVSESLNVLCVCVFICACWCLFSLSLVCFSASMCRYIIIYVCVCVHVYDSLAVCMLLLIAFIKHCSPLSSRFTVLACGSLSVTSSLLFIARFWICTEVVYYAMTYMLIDVCLHVSDCMCVWLPS